MQKTHPSIKQKKKLDKNKEVDFENIRLKKRVVELEKQLKDADMKAITFSTMLDIAGKYFIIPIRNCTIPSHRRNEK